MSRGKLDYAWMVTDIRCRLESQLKTQEVLEAKAADISDVPTRGLNIEAALRGYSLNERERQVLEHFAVSYYSGLRIENAKEREFQAATKRVQDSISMRELMKAMFVNFGVFVLTGDPVFSGICAFVSYLSGRGKIRKQASQIVGIPYREMWEDYNPGLEGRRTIGNLIRTANRGYFRRDF